MQLTPKNIHNGVIGLCEKINPGEKPRRVPVRPHPQALKDDCFPNVQKQILDKGGTMLHGWRITEFPGLFIEGEFHAVWVAPDETLIDVSLVDGESEVLFLPDSELSFSETQFNRSDNIRLVLSNHPLVHAFISHCEIIFRYKEAHTLPMDRSLFRVDRDEYEALLHRKAELELEMLLIKPGRNDPCRCGSGLKHKKCSGKNA